nr:hypothetical protein PHYPA_007021 [Physcomitrium patens]
MSSMEALDDKLLMETLDLVSQCANQTNLPRQLLLFRIRSSTQIYPNMTKALDVAPPLQTRNLCQGIE